MAKICQCCKGKGWHTMTLKDKSGKESHGCGIEHIVPCDAPACRNGKITKQSQEEYYRNIA